MNVVRAIASLTAGLSLGAGVASGAALLLYTSQGFLRTAGFLIGVALAALAGGIWVGAPELTRGRRAAARSRWIWTTLAFIVAGLYATVWVARPQLRTNAAAGALAVLIILAEPAYTAGMLLAALQPRHDGDTTNAAVPAIAGAALGVILATTLLIPHFVAPGVFLGLAALLAAVGIIESARAGSPTIEGRPAMSEQVVIVTGVGHEGQVGYALAERYLRENAHVVIASRGPHVLELGQRLAAAGTVVAVQADLTDPADAARVVEAARERFGRLDALINAAGGLTVMKTVSDTGPGEWRAEIERNAGTAFQMCRAALPLLRESRGAIVNFASPAGLRAVRGLAAYSAAKAAVVALTRALALEERKNGVRVNAIAPGMIDTRQNREQVEDPDSARWVTREEIANVTLFLTSAAASGISGETIHVPGDSLN